MAEEAGVEPTGDAFAPPDGFEDRAPHRGRYSSHTRPVPRPPGRSAEQIAGQNDARIADAAGRAHPIKIFENADGQIAADAGTILEHLRGEAPLGRGIGKRAGD